MPEALGVKTGYTAAAGHCLAAMARRDGRELIAVVLGSDRENYWKDAMALLEYGFALPSSYLQPSTPPLPLKAGTISDKD
jgi:D-alanyl-D-alanine carboxypeptidase